MQALTLLLTKSPALLCRERRGSKLYGMRSNPPEFKYLRFCRLQTPDQNVLRLVVAVSRGAGGMQMRVLQRR